MVVANIRKQMLTSAAALAISVAMVGTFNSAQAETAMNWSGFYIGGSIGVGGSKFASDISQPGIQKYGKGIIGGLHAGYNWQSGTLVFGVEGDVSAASFKTNLSDNSFSTDVLASLRGRLGLTFDRFMVYGTGGIGYAGIRIASSDSGKTKHTGRVRPVLGVGVEWALNNNLLLRAEGLDYFGRNSIGNEDEGGNRLGNIWVTRIGFSYKF